MGDDPDSERAPVRVARFVHTGYVYRATLGGWIERQTRPHRRGAMTGWVDPEDFRWASSQVIAITAKDIRLDGGSAGEHVIRPAGRIVPIA